MCIVRRSIACAQAKIGKVTCTVLEAVRKRNVRVTVQCCHETSTPYHIFASLHLRAAGDSGREHGPGHPGRPAGLEAAGEVGP